MSSNRTPSSKFPGELSYDVHSAFILCQPHMLLSSWCVPALTLSSEMMSTAEKTRTNVCHLRAAQLPAEEGDTS